MPAGRYSALSEYKGTHEPVTSSIFALLFNDFNSGRPVKYEIGGATTSARPHYLKYLLLQYFTGQRRAAPPSLRFSPPLATLRCRIYAFALRLQPNCQQRRQIKLTAWRFLLTRERSNELLQRINQVGKHVFATFLRGTRRPPRVYEATQS